MEEARVHDVLLLTPPIPIVTALADTNGRSVFKLFIGSKNLGCILNITQNTPRLISSSQLGQRIVVIRVVCELSMDQRADRHQTDVRAGEVGGNQDAGRGRAPMSGFRGRKRWARPLYTSTARG
ncbi:hypothetical protein LA080_010535 [Diaporthe eres]|nr:hypothetical protein LA080_010535 [Diaporthe eres]